MAIKQTADATSMSGDLTNGTYTLNSVMQQIDPGNTQANGCGLRFGRFLQAISVLHWTDANPDTEAAQAKYAWIQIPRVSWQDRRLQRIPYWIRMYNSATEIRRILRGRFWISITVTSADGTTVIQNGVYKSTWMGKIMQSVLRPLDIS